MNRRLYDDDRSGQPERPLRAAEYVRMSTDHQKYSTENQSDAIKQYAQARGIEIVKTYADAGKSGLKIEGRDALQQLIEDVKSGSADFTLVLVYDISRWGRFQFTPASTTRPRLTCTTSTQRSSRIRTSRLSPNKAAGSAAKPT